MAPTGRRRAAPVVQPLRPPPDERRPCAALRGGRSAAGRRRGGSPGLIDGFAAADDLLRAVGRGGRPRATFKLRPIRAPRGMTARLPTTVIPVLSRPGSWRLADVVGSVADDRALADDDLLVEDRPVDHGTRTDDPVEHDDRITDDGADVYAQPGESTEFRPCR